MNKKTKILNIRVEKDLYEFIEDVAKRIELDKSELVRRILEYHFLELFLDKLPKQNLREMRAEFIKKHSVDDI